jgi:N-acetylneuraminic acid mutarotase
MLMDGGERRIFTMQGLSGGRTHADIHARVWSSGTGWESWRALADIPVDEGRLAGVAVSAASSVWLFGGYTVAADGAELSTPEVFRLGAGEDRFSMVTEMPVPVDDMTAFVYRDRYIYLVSGWHDLGNVNLVQVLDTHSMSWTQATPFPGAAVFGHAGGMSGNRMLVCDGVRIEYPEDGSARRFLMSDECWLGSVDEQDYRRIQWQPVSQHPGPARYRMAATADADRGVVFAGGTDNPYNFDGVGYNGQPSEPQHGVFRFDFNSMTWQSGWTLAAASMDHRGMLYLDGWFYLAGGMLADQEVTGRVIRFRLLPPVKH